MVCAATENLISQGILRQKKGNKLSNYALYVQEENVKDNTEKTEKTTTSVARRKSEEQGCNQSDASDVRSAGVGGAAGDAGDAAVAALVGDRCHFASGLDQPACSCTRLA